MTKARGRLLGLWVAAWPVVGLIALVVLVAEVASAAGSAAFDIVVLTMTINVVAVVGLYMFVGNSGVFSFGHAAFMSVGAYCASLAVIPQAAKEFGLPELPSFLAGFSLSPIVAVVVGGLVAAGFAAVVGAPLMRLSGLTAALATFAVLVIVNVVAGNWTAVTNGTAGLSSVPIVTTLDEALIWMALAIVCAFVFTRSRVGLRLRASREDPGAAQSIGVLIARERWLALGLSAFFCGVAGALLTLSIGTLSPDSFYLATTFNLIAMLVVGGSGSLAGAVVGVVVVSALTEFLRQVEQGMSIGSLSVTAPAGLADVGLALVLLVILIVRPRGITGSKELRWPARWSLRGAGPTPGRDLGDRRPEPAKVAE